MLKADSQIKRATWAKPERAVVRFSWPLNCDRRTHECLTAIRETRSIGVLEFEWHDAKAGINVETHGVSFDLAKTVFRDPFAVERLDDREGYGEVRFVMIGMASGAVLLYVAYTEREERIRLISARRATTREQDDYYRQNS